MSWKRDPEWEDKPTVIRAYHNPETRGVYYVGTYETQDGYALSYWPNRNKDMETVTLKDTFDTKEAAVDALEETVK